MIHDCQYAHVIGKEPVWLTADGQEQVCSFCHSPKTQKAAVTKTAAKITKEN